MANSCRHYRPYAKDVHSYFAERQSFLWRPVTSDGDSIRRRLAQVRETKLGSRSSAKLARMLGLDPGTYARYETERDAPASVLATLATCFPNVNPLWLLTGVGEPYVDDVGSTPLAPADTAHPATIAAHLAAIAASAAAMAERTAALALDFTPQPAPQPPEIKSPDSTK